MRAYEIKNAMIDTLDIFLESNQWWDGQRELWWCDGILKRRVRE